MNEPKTILLYPGEFLSAVIDLDMNERGKLITLLCMLRTSDKAEYPEIIQRFNLTDKTILTLERFLQASGRRLQREIEVRRRLEN